MKWKDLSLKERKQIYDSVRANNPDATYFDIKEQFDSIPTYEDGQILLLRIRLKNIYLIVVNMQIGSTQYYELYMIFDQINKVL